MKIVVWDEDCIVQLSNLDSGAILTYLLEPLTVSCLKDSIKQKACEALKR